MLNTLKVSLRKHFNLVIEYILKTKIKEGKHFLCVYSTSCIHTVLSAFYCTNLQTLLGFHQRTARTIRCCCSPSITVTELSPTWTSCHSDGDPRLPPPLAPPITSPPVLPALLATLGESAAHRLDTCDSSVTHHTPLQYVRHRGQRSPSPGGWGWWGRSTAGVRPGSLLSLQLLLKRWVSANFLPCEKSLDDSKPAPHLK